MQKFFQFVRNFPANSWFLYFLLPICVIVIYVIARNFSWSDKKTDSIAQSKTPFLTITQPQIAVFASGSLAYRIVADNARQLKSSSALTFTNPVLQIFSGDRVLWTGHAQSLRYDKTIATMQGNVVLVQPFSDTTVDVRSNTISYDSQQRSITSPQRTVIVYGHTRIVAGSARFNVTDNSIHLDNSVKMDASL